MITLDQLRDLGVIPHNVTRVKIVQTQNFHHVTVDCGSTTVNVASFEDAAEAEAAWYELRKRLEDLR